jgi:hypothetical protein
MPWLQIDDWLAQHREQLDEASLQQHLAQVDQRIGGQQYGSPPESRTTRPGPPTPRSAMADERDGTRLDT